MRLIKYISLMLLVVALTIYTYSMRLRTIEKSNPPDLSLIVSSSAEFTGTDSQLEAESLLILGADATLFRNYSKKGSVPIWLFLGYFESQQEYSQIHSPKHCYPGAGWNILNEESVLIETPTGTIRATKLIISDGIYTRIVVYWFSTPSGALTDEFALKWYQTRQSLLGRPQVSTFIRFSAPVPNGMDEAAVEKDLLNLIESMTASIESVLGGQAAKGS